jgi:Na+-driven multidrug efflux pump
MAEDVVVVVAQAVEVRGEVRARSMMQQVIALALPSIVSSISVTVMNFTNNLMIARMDAALPEAEKLNLAAAMNGGMSAWVFVIGAMGVGTAVNTLSSQSLGRGEREHCGGYAWQGLWVALLSVLFFLPVSMLGWPVFHLLGHEARLVPVEAHFFQVMTWGAPVVLASGVMSNFYLGVHRPGIQMVAAICGNVVDSVLCYAMLFGAFGFPKVGVSGSAYATIWGSATILVGRVVVVDWRGVGRAVGVGTAVNAMVGRKIGEKRFDLAHQAAFAGMKLTMTYMGTWGVIFFFFRHQLAWAFLEDPERAGLAAQILLLAALFQAFDGMNVVFISALRGAGDVRQPTVVMVCLSWGVCVGGGVLVAWLLPGMKALGPWVMATIYICLVACYVFWRWRGEAWKRVDVFAK